MDRFVQKWPRIVSMEEWRSKVHPDVLALPWASEDGVEICSFSILPLMMAGGILVVLYDAHGREVVRSGDHAAIEATALALGAKTNELTFLPVAGGLRFRALR